MSIAIVDARDWQSTVDLKTGDKIDVDGRAVEMAKDVLKRHPYPGDMDRGSNRWVTDTALDLMERYEPRLLFLTYAAQYFAGRFSPMTGEERSEMISDALLEVQRFIGASGLSAVVLGTGNMTPLVDFIDLTRLDGLAVCTHWSAGYAGIYEPSRRDLETLNMNPYIERVAPREEVAGIFNGTAGQALKLPEYLVLAQEGYSFKTLRSVMKNPVMIPGRNFHIPVYAPGHTVEAITDIRGVLEQSLLKERVVLIVMEGIGLNELAWSGTSCLNSNGWCYYEPGEAQYLTIVTGRHRFLDYPPGYKPSDEKEETENYYPFSGHFKSIPEGPFAQAFSGKSIAVGNKSMFMHMVTGADISIECFARNLFNQGTMAVVHRDDK